MKVKSVQHVVLSEPVPVFDIEVPSTSNFKLAVGPYVHNSKDVADAVCGAYSTMLHRRTSWLAAASDDEAAINNERAEYEERYEAERA